MCIHGEGAKLAIEREAENDRSDILHRASTLAMKMGIQDLGRESHAQHFASPPMAPSFAMVQTADFGTGAGIGGDLSMSDADGGPSPARPQTHNGVVLSPNRRDIARGMALAPEQSTFDVSQMEVHVQPLPTSAQTFLVRKMEGVGAAAPQGRKSSMVASMRQDELAYGRKQLYMEALVTRQRRVQLAREAAEKSRKALKRQQQSEIAAMEDAWRQELADFKQRTNEAAAALARTVRSTRGPGNKSAGRHAHVGRCLAIRNANWSPRWRRSRTWNVKSWPPSGQPRAPALLPRGD